MRKKCIIAVVIHNGNVKTSRIKNMVSDTRERAKLIYGAMINR